MPPRSARAVLGVQDAPERAHEEGAQVASEARQLLGREERRDSILLAAARAFAAEGYATTSMEDVAAHAGVTKLILYRHFEGKEELYRAVLDEVSTRMRQEFVRVVNGPPDRGGPVRALLNVGRANPDGYRLLVFHAPREPRFEPQVRGYWDDAVRTLADRLGPSVPDAALRDWTIRSLLLYLLHEVLIWLEVGDPGHDDAFVARATEGLAALVQVWTDGTD